MDKLPTQYLELSDIKIAYTEHGSGPALLLLHGNSENKGIFSEYQQVHFKDFHTYALDSRGHGESVSDDSKISIRQFSEDVIAFCKAKGLAQAFVIGYSDGGNIALFLAQKEPGMYPKLAPISPNYLASGTVGWFLGVVKFLSGILRPFSKRDAKARRMVLVAGLMLKDIGLTPEELGGIRTNLHFLHAEKDLIKETHILEMVRLVPGATVSKIMGCNHMNILHKAQAVEDLRKYFLAG